MNEQELKATAVSILVRCAHGFADDLVTLALLATRAPVLLALAVHEQMWTNRVAEDNVAKLKQ